MPLSCSRGIQKVLTIKRTYSDLKFDVESIGDGLGAIGDALMAINAKTSLFSILATFSLIPHAQILTKMLETLYECSQRLDQ